MRAYCLKHVGDQTLLRDLAALVAKDRATTAALLAHIAEVDERRLYAPAGYASMYEYCVRELRLSEQAAYKRIQAGRAGRRTPLVFPAVADGRLHLSAVVTLAAYLTRENAGDLITAASGKTKAEIELLLAQRFPKPDLPPVLRVQPAPGQLEPHTQAPAAQLSPGIVHSETPMPTAQLATGTVATPRPSVKPLSPERFVLQVTVSEATHDKLQYAKALLSHTIPSGDLAQVLDRALDALIAQQEKRKFAATDRPRKALQRRNSTRTIPAHVRRAVWERDGGQCTFRNESGQRCTALRLLEFDHVEPVARGGLATAGNMRLRCRTHNRHAAEREFGLGFMSERREAARRVKEHRQSTAADRDVMACLRTLGYRADESRRAVTFSSSDPDATLESRVRLALSYFRPRVLSRVPAALSAARAT